MERGVILGGDFSRVSNETLQAIADSDFDRKLFLVFDGFKPRIDTSPIREFSKAVFVQNGSLSPAQTSDLLNNAEGLALWNLETIVDSKAKADLPPFFGNPYLNFLQENSPGAIAKFLDPLESTAGISSIWGNSNIPNEADWNAIIRATNSSQFLTSGSIYRLESGKIRAGFGGDISFKIDPADRAQTRRILLSYTEIFPLSEASDQEIELLSYTDAFFWGHIGSGFSGQDYWDLYFAIKGRTSIRQFESGLTAQSLETRAKEYHWVYKSDSEKRVTHLFVPVGPKIFERQDLIVFPELTELSFNTRWLCQTVTPFGSTNSSVDFSFITQWPKLKSLYLPSRAYSEDLCFLKSLPSLEHLEIASPEFYEKPIDFPICPRLTSLKLYGIPNKKTIESLSKFPKLASLTLIDHDDEGLSKPEYVKSLHASLPNISIAIVPFKDTADHIPKVPVEFSEHIEKISKSLLKKLLKDRYPEDLE